MAKISNSVHTSTLNTTGRLIGKTPIARTSFSVSFAIRQPYKLPQNTKGFIYMWLNYGRKRLCFSTGIKASPKDFHAESGVVHKDPDKTMLLSSLKSKAETFSAELSITGRPMDLNLIKACVLGKRIEMVPSALECVRIFNHKIIKPLYENGELEKGSFNKLECWDRHLERWILDKIGRSASIAEILPAEANHLLLWLKSKHNLSHNVACRIVAHLKRILNYAVENEWIIRNPFMNFRKKLVKRKLDFLSELEMEKLEGAKFASQALDQLRDIFLFQCYTSLSYNELRDLTPSHIALVDGYAFIRIARKKTSGKTFIEQIIPLVPQAARLIEQYRDHEVCRRYGVCFPVQSNQKFNALLKQIAMVTGIAKRLTSHVGRRTAATHYLKQGVPLVSVSAMLGHSNTKVTQDHYAHIQPEMVIRDFKPLLKTAN
jgi:integrase/recombinase XerD